MKSSIAFIAVLLIASAVRGADQSLAWPQFRGPGGSGIADDQHPPVEIGPDKNVAWKVTVPPVASSPIVVGDKLVITALDDGKLYTIAYNRDDGREACVLAPAKELEAYHKIEGSPAASTCAMDGERIVSYFGSCGLLCYDLSGKELWKFEMPLPSMFGNFGSGVSPIIADGTVILPRDEAKDPKIIVVDLATGKLKWEQQRDPSSAIARPSCGTHPRASRSPCRATPR